LPSPKTPLALSLSPCEIEDEKTSVHICIYICMYWLGDEEETSGKTQGIKCALLYTPYVYGEKVPLLKAF